MFTVVFCSEIFYKNCTKTHVEFLGPFLKGGDFAFCRWNPLADTLEESVPDLKQLVEDKVEWRALIVVDEEIYGYENIKKRNPYNYINSISTLEELHSAEEIFAFRQKNDELLNQAVQNPIVKLGMWLTGAPSTEYPAIPEEFKALPEPNDAMYFEALLQNHLSAMEVELERLTEKKGKILEENFALEGELAKKPTQIITLCERMYVNENDSCKAAWEISQEHAYSRFFEDNLYAKRMRFLVTDVNYIKGRRVSNSYFNFLVLSLMLARIDSYEDFIRQGRVYKIGVEVNRERLSECYYMYLNKLNATLQLLQKIKRKQATDNSTPLNNREFEEAFISDVTIPVEVSREFSTTDLFCEYEKVGLSKDCPGDEAQYWDSQYRDIEKKFIRYLREPRRALKVSVSNDLRNEYEINDERSEYLTEFQREEVEIRLWDEEEEMIRTRTIQLYKTKEYTDQLGEADKELKRGIGQRMTKKKTLIISAVALVAYFIGFIPLLLGNSNTIESFMVSLLLTGVVMALFAGIGFIWLFVLRKRLVNRFKHFNYVMSGILADIESGMQAFSRYLSHCCNVMREFSVLNWAKTAYKNRKCVIKKHEYRLTRELEKAQTLFAGNIDKDMRVTKTIDPYEYDFNADEEYCFEMESVLMPGKCRFLNANNEVETPVDYIEAITLTREELYD